MIYKCILKKIPCSTATSSPCADSENNVTEEPFLYAICTIDAMGNNEKAIFLAFFTQEQL